MGLASSRAAGLRGRQRYPSASDLSAVGMPASSPTGDARPAFVTPGYPFVPALFVLAAAYVVISSIAANPGNAAIGGAILAAGIPVFYLSRRSFKS